MPTQRSATGTTPGLSPSEGRPTVLVVEDDDHLRVALDAGLSAEGFSVHVAPDADVAYRVAADLRPDIVLLDWIMPGGDAGVIACRRLCGMVPETTVVMFSGLSDARDERAALEAGARAFLVKGMSLETLAGKLRGYLSA